MLELFVSGTGRNSGKTFITAGLAATMQSLGYGTCVYKPVQTSAVLNDDFLESPDLAFVKLIDPYVKTYFSYLFKDNSIPLVAAELENTVINAEVIYQDYKSLDYECIIADGTNGLTTPLGSNFLEQDLVKMLDIPVILVVSPLESSVDTILAIINNAVLSKVKLRGVIINNCPEIIDANVKTLPKLITEYTDTKVLGAMPYISDLKRINPNDLISHVLKGIDIEKVFDVKIAKLSL